MNFRTTILLLVVAIAVGVTVYFVHDKPEKKEKTEAAKEHKLLDFDSADVNKLSIASPDGSRIVLQKTGADWKLVEPIAAAAKTFEVDEIVRALTDLQSRGQVDASKKTSGGLDHPSFIVELTTSSGKTASLSFGENSKVGDAMYVLLNKGDKPDVVGTAIFAKLDQPASHYRETRLVAASTDDVKQLSVTSKGKTLRLEKHGENWQITEPVQLPAETSAVSDLLFGISNLTAMEFVDKPAHTGLNHPRLSVWFSNSPPSTQPASTQPTGGQTVSFGGYQDIRKTNLYVSLDQKEVAIVPATSLKTFEKTPLDLRNKELATIDPELVSTLRVSITHPATTQPTTKPAEVREFAIERRKIAPPVLGPELPPGVPPVTQHASPATQAASPATRSASPATTAAATASHTQPSLATTKPSAPATKPVVAMTQPAAPATQPASKWFFSSADHANADEGQVTGLLNGFHPLRVEKYVEPESLQGTTYTVTLHAVPAKAEQVAHDYTFTLVDTGMRIVGTYKDAHFEAERSLIEKLNGDFKTKKPEPPPFQPGMQPGLPPGHPPFPMRGRPPGDD